MDRVGRKRLRLAFALFGCCTLTAQSVANAGTEKVIHSFQGTDGAYPIGMINVGGTLYGTTNEGGQPGPGTVFALDPDTGSETVLYSFCSQKKCADGYEPASNLLLSNTTVYGTTTFGGGKYSRGVVYALNLQTGNEKTLSPFRVGTADVPQGALIELNGILYGVAAAGGANDLGVVYSVDPTSGEMLVLHSFGSSGDGAFPNAGLIKMKGTLYGTTGQGGAFGGGTVFSFEPSTGNELVVYSFCAQANCTDGSAPISLTNVSGAFYGTTATGGMVGCEKTGCGTVFSLDPTTGMETVLYAFQGKRDGAFPFTRLLSFKHLLYGTTVHGGMGKGQICKAEKGCGTIFSLDPQTDVESVVYTFCRKTTLCLDGAFPGPLVNVNGKMYGTTGEGGTNDWGTVFLIKP